MLQLFEKTEPRKTFYGLLWVQEVCKSLPAHLWGLLLLLVVMACRWASVRRRPPVATVRERLRVCVAVRLSVVGLAVRRRSDAPGYPGGGEDGGTLGGQESRGGRQDPHAGAWRCRETRVRWGVESRRGSGNKTDDELWQCKQAFVWLKRLYVTKPVYVLWPFDHQVECSALHIYEAHGLSMTELCTHMVADSNKFILLLQSSSARFASPANLRGIVLITHINNCGWVKSTLSSLPPDLHFLLVMKQKTSLLSSIEPDQTAPAQSW